MRPGYFFESIEGTQTEVSEVIFRYLGVEHAGGYPIYLSIEKEKIFFGITLPGEYEHSELLELYFSDFDNDSGKLSRQLLGIADLTQHHKIFIESRQNVLPQSQRLGKQDVTVSSYSSCFGFGTKIPDEENEIFLKDLFPNPVINLLEAVIGIGKTEVSSQGEITPPKTETGVCLRTLFLDFLFDLKHSDVLKNSRYYDQLLLISRENYVFSSILNFLESKYWRSVSRPDAEVEDNNLLSEFSTSERINSAKNWIKTLIDSRTTTTLANSGWISRPLEDELYETLTSEIENLPTKKDEREDPLWEEITEWSVSRLSYIRIVALLIPLNAWHIIIFIIPWILLGFLAMTCPYDQYVECQCEGLIPNLTRRVLLILSLCMTVGVSIYSLNSKYCGQSKGRLLKSILYLISPRFLISGLIGWTLVSKLYIPEMIPNLEIVSRPFFVLLMACLGIPVIYLSRELSLVAKDLTAKVIIKRSGLAVGVFFILILLLGLASEIFVEIFQGNSIDPWQIILEAPFVFFSTIFFNFLFAGKRFTGM